MGASIWRSSHSFVRSTIASLSQNNQRVTYGQQREDVGSAPAEPSCCPYPPEWIVGQPETEIRMPANFRVAT